MTADPTNLSSKPGQGRAGPDDDAAAGDGSRATGPSLSLVGWLRWAWRQLTSMRTAILLLLLLAVAALPGAFIPQQASDPAAVSQFRAERPELSGWLDRLDLFDMYGSIWFQTVYVLLFVSLIGCIVPRIGVHVRSLRAAPPKVPGRLTRFAGHSVRRDPTRTPAELGEAARLALRRRFRAVVSAKDDGTVEVSAERGYLRETGNIVFHLALLAVLVAFGLGQMISYRGQAIVVEGESFANSVVDYDSFTAGSLVRTGSLDPFVVRLDEFSSEFTLDAQARDFLAEVSVTRADGTAEAGDIAVNHPLNVDGTNIYLSGNGYAPRLTVHDGAGEVAFSQPVPFLPEDGVYTSRGVVKVPDVSGDQEQLGLTGTFLPTAIVDTAGTPVSIHPQPEDPLLVLTLWVGDLGLDEGEPQNVYVLDTDRMRQVYEPAADGSAGSAEGGQVPLTIYLGPGDTVELPEGLGSITFEEELPRFVALDLRNDPTLPYLLAASIAAMLGLFGSLFVPRRRVWVRLTSDGDGTRLETAALARGDDPGTEREVERLLAALDLEEDSSDGDVGDDASADRWDGTGDTPAPEGTTSDDGAAPPSRGPDRRPRPRPAPEKGLGHNDITERP
ncbi:cytochrome c biogenesis protein ResB [Georgenia sp. Z1491]|uniref:cytochrome c biogenesis protein ResB n=1 Tax=Georgenia sp. Z1491 TaxID=3416707 RepID=UPI003CF1985C